MKLLVFSDSHGMPLYMRESHFTLCAATVTSAAQTCRYAKF